MTHSSVTKNAPLTIRISFMLFHPSLKPSRCQGIRALKVGTSKGSWFSPLFNKRCSSCQRFFGGYAKRKHSKSEGRRVKKPKRLSSQGFIGPLPSHSWP